MPATTIDEVIIRLEQIVEVALDRKDPLGIFALVYLGVTRSVKEGILNNAFQDGPRMERIDVIFANRYLDAQEAFLASQPYTQAWQSTFSAASKFDLLVLQHLLMGMNAHINLDLCVATAEAVGPDELAAVESDFNKINELLVAQIDEMQRKLNKVSPLLFLVDWYGKRFDERFASFGLVKARTNAWKFAGRLSQLKNDDKLLVINELDGYVALLNKGISNPGKLIGTVVRFIKWFEVKDVSKVLILLRD